jgi:hypothetical protein
MLTFSSNVFNIVPREKTFLNNSRQFDSVFKHSSNHNSTYIETPYVGDLYLPFLINNIDLHQETLILGRDCLEVGTIPTARITSTIDNLITDCNESNKIRWIKIYCPVEFKEALTSLIDPDLWTGVHENIIEITNKVMQQLELREDLSYTPEMKFYKHRLCNTVIQVLDTMDHRQATEDFYFIGLIPQLFPEISELFSVDEFNFFDELVHRAMLKRIGNADAQNFFNIMCATEKYQTAFEDVKLRNVVNSVAQGKIDNYKNLVREAENRMDSLMREYNGLLKTQRETNILLMNQMQTIDNTKEEIYAALKTEGLVDYNIDGYNRLDFYVKAPITFYEMDILESLLDNDRLYYTPKVREFFNKVFITQEYKLVVAHRFNFSFAPDASFNLPSASEDKLQTFNASINPHLAFFSCLGNYKPTLIKLQKEQNLLMFVHTAIASVKSINFTDGTVFRRWCEYLEDKFERPYTTFMNTKCLEDAEGNLHTPYEVFIENEIVEEIEVHDS